MTDNAALPTMFRTLSALKDTEQHLLDYLDSDDPRLGLGRVSMYMWDRQRSIRQDIAWQKMEVLSAGLPLSMCCAVEAAHGKALLPSMIMLGHVLYNELGIGCMGILLCYINKQSTSTLLAVLYCSTCWPHAVPVTLR